MLLSRPADGEEDATVAALRDDGGRLETWLLASMARLEEGKTMAEEAASAADYSVVQKL